MTDDVLLDVFVPGIPRPQGSLKSVGRGVLVPTDPGLMPWRDSIWHHVAREIVRDQMPVSGPVAINLTFLFPRPNFHFGSGKNAKAVMPRFEDIRMVVRPDIDKLVRAVLDALTNLVYRDDAQVWHLIVSKRYVVADEKPGVLIRAAS